MGTKRWIPSTSVQAVRQFGLEAERQAAGWSDRFGNRSARDRVLDQQKEQRPRDPTICARFDTYRFADHKARTVDQIGRVARVSVETVEIIAAKRVVQEASRDRPDRHGIVRPGREVVFGPPARVVLGALRVIPRHGEVPMRFLMRAAVLVAVGLTGAGVLATGPALGQAAEPSPPSGPVARPGNPVVPEGGVPVPILPPGVAPRQSAPAARGADCGSRRAPDIGVCSGA